VGAFGEKLRKQRERRGIALDAISNTTKISTRMLRALEDEHFDQLPGGVFNKGFVRAYARQVGLDEEEAVTDYLAALRESQIQQQSILPDFRASGAKPVAAPPTPRNHEPRPGGLPGGDLPGDDGHHLLNAIYQRERRKKEGRGHHPEDPSASDPMTDPAERSPNKYPAGSPAQPAREVSAQIPWGKLAAALLLVTLVLALWNLRRHTGPKTASQASASPQQSDAPAPVPVPAAAPSPRTASANSLTGGKPSSAGTLPSGTIKSETISGETASPRPAPMLTPANPLAKTSTPAATVKPPPTFTLLIRAEENTWVSIVADGKPVAEETLIAPAHTSVRASHEVLVRAGNAAGVSFQLNGKEFPAQGNEGEVKTYIFDATSVRVEPQPQAPVPNR
jgi:hypothetical protein